MFKKLILVILFSQACYAADYLIDSNHSSVGFIIKHLAISKVPGSFTDFSGSITYDPNNVSAATATATIKASSIDTDVTKRDEHLRSADFFDVTKFPEITFNSSSVKAINTDQFEVTGNLKIRDVTKQVVLTVVKEGTAIDPSGKEKIAFTATTRINRKDFGLTWSKLLETGALVVGEEVDITLEIAGTKK